MVVDTSALFAALSGERRAGLVLDALAADPAPYLSAGTLLETRMVMLARSGEEGVRDLDLLLHAAQATVVPVSRDLFAYGLASLRAEPLLFVGDDFARTDVTPVA